MKEIAEKTGLNYKTLRMTVSRMHEAGLIAHPFRGRYTTLEQDAASKKRLEEEIKARELGAEAFRKLFARDATVTSDTSDATDANVTNSSKFGTASQLYRTPPDPCGSYQHSFHEQSRGNQPAVVQAVQSALVSTLPVDLPHRKPQIWTTPHD